MYMISKNNMLIFSMCGIKQAHGDKIQNYGVKPTEMHLQEYI